MGRRLRATLLCLFCFLIELFHCFLIELSLAKHKLLHNHYRLKILLLGYLGNSYTVCHTFDHSLQYFRL
jgi:hypothetical protein